MVSPLRTEARRLVLLSVIVAVAWAVLVAAAACSPDVGPLIHPYTPCVPLDAAPDARMVPGVDAACVPGELTNGDYSPQ